MSFDPILFGQAMGELINQAIAPLLGRVAELEKRLSERTEVEAIVTDEVAKAMAGVPAAKDGKDCDMELVQSMIDEAVKAIPLSKDGKDGKDADPEHIEKLVRAAFDEAPKPSDGKSITADDVRPILDVAIKQIRQDADDAVAGALKLIESSRGEVIKRMDEIRQPADGTSVTIEDVRPIVDEAVKKLRINADSVLAEALDQAKSLRDALEKSLEELRQPEDGKSITLDDVRPLIEAEIERATSAIPVPSDGAGVAGAMIDREGVLLLTLSNGEVKSLGVVVGKDGADFTETNFEYDGERTLTIQGKGGAIKKCLPIPLDRGYYRDGMSMEKGDIVTHDGNAWIAMKDTKQRPGHEVKDDWRLFARKGRDGESVVRKINDGPAAPIRLGE